MSDQDLFDETQKPKDNDQQPATPAKDQASPSTPNYDQMLEMIVNAEGSKKYNTVDEALKGAAHAQAHIANLERELEQLRNANASSNKIEDVIAAIQAQKDNDQRPSDEGNKISPTDIQDLVKNVVMDINNQATQEQNIKQVTGKFKELYGEKASETLYGKANDLGFSREDINGLIAKNPTAALKLLGIDSKPASTGGTVESSSVNTDSFNHKPKETPQSSMGYVSTKQLTEHWLKSKEKTLERLGLKT